MNGVTSFRWMFFVMFMCFFWMFAPLFIVSRFTGPLGAGGLIISLACVWYVMPKADAWLVANTPFGKVKRWARAHEETP